MAVCLGHRPPTGIGKPRRAGEVWGHLAQVPRRVCLALLAMAMGWGLDIVNRRGCLPVHFITLLSFANREHKALICVHTHTDTHRHDWTYDLKRGYLRLGSH